MSSSHNSTKARPDIFITGVMKGGTSILHDYICSHSQVVSGSQKEIHYFSLNFHEGQDWYHSHFSDVPAGMRTIDASPTYFDVANTALLPKLIRAYTADPRVMLITRDPIERAISHFTHLQKVNKVESLEGMSADEFFSRPLAQAFGQSDDWLMYLNLVLNFSFYYRRFVNYRHLFEKHQFLALDNARLRSDPKSVMQDVFGFLNLDYQHDKSFGEVRRSNGSSLGNISTQTYHRLAELFYPDYEKFCHQAGFKFVEATPTVRAA